MLGFKEVAHRLTVPYNHFSGTHVKVTICRVCVTAVRVGHSAPCDVADLEPFHNYRLKKAVFGVTT